MKIECNSSLLMIETGLDVSDRNHTSVSTHDLTVCMTRLHFCGRVVKLASTVRIKMVI